MKGTKQEGRERRTRETAREVEGDRRNEKRKLQTKGESDRVNEKKSKRGKLWRRRRNQWRRKNQATKEQPELSLLAQSTTTVAVNPHQKKQFKDFFSFPTLNVC